MIENGTVISALSRKAICLNIDFGVAQSWLDAIGLERLPGNEHGAGDRAVVWRVSFEDKA